MESSLENVIRTFRDTLLEAFRDWLDKNEEAIGEKWYSRLMKQMTDADCNTAIKIMGTSMWMFNIVADLGVLAGIGPNRVSIVEIREGLDKPSSERLLRIISACMNLQYLPREVGNEPIAIISAKQFSLKLYTQTAQK